VFIATARGETRDLALTIPWIISASRETGEAPYLWMSFPPVAWATLDRADDAGPPLVEAREVFVTLGARPSIAEVDGLLNGDLAESG